MIKYHGTPITPNRIFDEALDSRNCLIPFPRREQFRRAVKTCDKIIIDNGAFTIWKKGINIDWNEYYEWIESVVDDIDYFFIPDVIDGSEEENDLLISNFFLKFINNDKVINKAIPIWHVNESIKRIDRLIDSFDYIAIGSAGEYAELGTEKWHKRMNDVMSVICNSEGVPKVKTHMLRCLDPRIFTKYPFYSGDSTNLARNHSKRGWRNIINGIEKYNSPKTFNFRTYYETPSLFDCTRTA